MKIKNKIQKFGKGPIFVLISFLGSILGIFGFIISLFNSHAITKINNQMQVGVNNGNINSIAENTGSINIDQSQNTLIPKTKEEERIESITRKAKHYVGDFYTYMNNKNYDDYYKLFDKVLINSQAVNTYFSRARLNNFYGKIDGSIGFRSEIEEMNAHHKNEEYSTKRGFGYTIQYVIKGQVYKERWEMILVSYDKGEKFYVNSIKCVTKGCGRLPFFN